MAHPNKKDADRSKSSKFHAMTRDYGMSGGKDDYITEPGERLKGEVGDSVPENSVGFGAESSARTSKRGDRPARRAVAANPVATYKRGGKVKHRDGGGDVSAIEEANRDEAATRAKGGKVRLGKPEKVGHSGDKLGLNVMSKMKGMPVIPLKTTKTGPAKNDPSGYTNEEKIAKPRARGGMLLADDGCGAGNVSGRARGGRLHGKGKGATHVNVMVAPQGSPPAGAGGPPPQLAALLAGAHPPAGGPPMGGPPPGPPMPPPGGPPGAGLPPGGPPMPMRKRGGMVMGKHPDASQDKELIHKTLKEEGLVRKARGGGIHMTAGAVTGNGRLEKMGVKVPGHRDGMKPQAV